MGLNQSNFDGPSTLGHLGIPGIPGREIQKMTSPEVPGKDALDLGNPKKWPYDKSCF